jgi:hypothetical protein
MLVHGGMEKASFQILGMVKETIVTALKEFPDYTLFVTGHSLGAGVAELITMHLASHKEGEEIKMKNRFHCVALAPPPVYRMTDLDSSVDMEKYIDAYIFGEDCVPRCSIGNIARLVAIANEVDKTEIKVQPGTAYKKVI